MTHTLKSTRIKSSKQYGENLLYSASLGFAAFILSQTASAITTKNVTYTVDNQAYEGRCLGA